MLCCLLLAFRGDQTYRFPLDGSIRITGTFGELRLAHFHTGIDLSTGGVTGLPVHAIEDGYIYRIKRSPFGYGNAIYLKHADGKFSVYAHLESFTPEIEEVVYQHQVATFQSEQEIYPLENEYPVKKGNIIGFSGNSGLSTGPHLHFEIRDPDERIINPVSYYKQLIQDNVPPTVKTVAFQPISARSLVNGTFEKVSVKVEGSPGNYTVPCVTELNGPVGLEFTGYDLLSGGVNPCGLYSTKLYLDGNLLFEYRMDRFSFDEKKYVYVYADYDWYMKGMGWSQKCYLDYGNDLACYRNVRNRGFLELTDYQIHTYRVELSDIFGNTTSVTGQVKRGFVQDLPKVLNAKGATRFEYEVNRNILKFTIINPQTPHLKGMTVTFERWEDEVLTPRCYKDGRLVFVYELADTAYPQKFTDPVTGRAYPFWFRQRVSPEVNTLVKIPEAELFFPAASLFDTLNLEVRTWPRESETLSPLIQAGTLMTPVLNPFLIRFTPGLADKNRNLCVGRKNRSGQWMYVDSQREPDGNVIGSPGDFGTFALMEDNEGPVITPGNFKTGQSLSASSKKITFKVKDNFSGLDSRRVYLTVDGVWNVCEFDAKASLLVWKPHGSWPTGKHTFDITAFDKVNNKTVVSFSIQLQ